MISWHCLTVLGISADSSARWSTHRSCIVLACSPWMEIPPRLRRCPTARLASCPVFWESRLQRRRRLQFRLRAEQASSGSMPRRCVQILRWSIRVRMDWRAHVVVWTNHSNKTRQLHEVDLWLLCEALPGHCHELLLAFRECDSHLNSWSSVL
jgi:hypothetical protein